MALQWYDASIVRAQNRQAEPKCEHGRCITGNADCAIGTTNPCAKCGEPICACCGRIRRREAKAPQNVARSIPWFCEAHGEQWGETCPYCVQAYK